jgi:hypothetical protein
MVKQNYVFACDNIKGLFLHLDSAFPVCSRTAVAFAKARESRAQLRKNVLLSTKITADKFRLPSNKEVIQ